MSAIDEIIRLMKSWTDNNQTVQKIEKRMWSIAARSYNLKAVLPQKGETLTAAERREITDMVKAVLAGKCDDAQLVLNMMPFLEGRKPFVEAQKAIEAKVSALVKELPIYDWFTSHRGLKAMSLAHLVGSGDKDWAEFPKPASLWKWYGLDVQGGHAPKMSAGKTRTFKPERRAAAIGIIGEQLIKQDKGKWKALYDKRKEYELRMAAERGLTVKPSASITPKQKASGLFMSKGHVANRARRYMVKQFLKEMWELWTGNVFEETPEFLKVA